MCLGAGAAPGKGEERQGMDSGKPIPSPSSLLPFPGLDEAPHGVRSGFRLLQTAFSYCITKPTHPPTHPSITAVFVASVTPQSCQLVNIPPSTSTHPKAAREDAPKPTDHMSEESVTGDISLAVNSRSRAHTAWSWWGFFVEKPRFGQSFLVPKQEWVSRGVVKHQSLE